MVTKREMVSASETESEDEEKDSSKKKAVLKARKKSLNWINFLSLNFLRLQEKEATNKPKPVVEEPNKEDEDGSGKKKKGSGSKAKKATAAVSPAKAKKAQPSIMNFFQKKSTWYERLGKISNLSYEDSLWPPATSINILQWNKQISNLDAFFIASLVHSLSCKDLSLEMRANYTENLA